MTRPADTLAHMRRLQARRALASEARAERLLALVPQAARLLRERHQASHVVLFGSLATGRAHPESDVDLAVEGLPPERYFDALADLMDLFVGPVDLVRLEEAPASLVDRVRAEGRPL